ncbi:MAG: GGDEF domain-containing protein [Granulosicoccus sp.]
MSGGTRIWETHGDFRANATRGVALAAVMLLLPFTIYAFFREIYVVAFGGAYITTILVINTQLVARGRDHEPMTLYGLVPGGILCMFLAFRIDGAMASIWCYPSVLACYCMLGRRKAIIANMMILAVAVPMMWLTLEIMLSARFSASLVAVSVFASILVRELDAQQQRLMYQLDHDPLTGLLNRTSLKRQLQHAINEFQDRFTPATLLALDLDHFKNVNDRYGHDTGDIVLCEVARLLKQHVPDGCPIFRLGGEEFLVLLANIENGDALEQAESLRALIAETDILQGHPVTVSIGTASLRVSDDRGSWSRRSDDQLYAAKHAGRNRVVSDNELDLENPAELILQPEPVDLEESEFSPSVEAPLVGG